MATVRAGEQAVLIVVDVQVGVVRDAWGAARVVTNVALAVERARAAGVPVIWVQHSDDDLPEGNAEWQWVPELMPQPGEARVHKHFNSAFEDTGLEAELARLGATRIVLAGCASNWCIRATAYGALDRGYDLVLVKDAHTTGSIELGGGRRVEAADIVAELNVGMKWVAYPGRSSGVAGAGEVEFGGGVGVESR